MSVRNSLLGCVLSFAVIACVSCGWRKPASVGPNWSIWKLPHPAALEVSDPAGDTEGPRKVREADLKSFSGTYDADYVYFRLEVYAEGSLDGFIGAEYSVSVDANGNDVIDAGDYTLFWNSSKSFTVKDANDRLVRPGKLNFYCKHGLGGGLYFALPRGAVSSEGFNVQAQSLSRGTRDSIPSAPARFKFE